LGALLKLGRAFLKLGGAFLKLGFQGVDQPVIHVELRLKCRRIILRRPLLLPPPPLTLGGRHWLIADRWAIVLHTSLPTVSG
jgi:hypothetical protein